MVLFISSGLLKSVKGNKMIDMNKNDFNTINLNKTLWDAGQIKCLKYILEIHAGELMYAKIKGGIRKC